MTPAVFLGYFIVIALTACCGIFIVCRWLVGMADEPEEGPEDDAWESMWDDDDIEDRIPPPLRKGRHR